MLTSRLDAYNSRYGNFCAHDNDNDNDTTDYFTPCACVRDTNHSPELDGGCMDDGGPTSALPTVRNIKGWHNRNIQNNSCYHNAS